MKKLVSDVKGVVDVGVVIMIGIVFAGMMALAYLIFTVRDALIPTYPVSATGAAGNASRLAWNTTYGNADASVTNITGGFDDAWNLILVAITIFILAIAISALLMLRGGRQ